jgi:hypothetical protein
VSGNHQRVMTESSTKSLSPGTCRVVTFPDKSYR